MHTINENGATLGAIHQAQPDSTRDTANYLFNVTEQSGACTLVSVRAPFDMALAFVRGLYPDATLIEDWDTTESAPDYTLF